MKRIILCSMIAFMVVSLAFAQPISKTAKLTEDEVPVAVRLAFKNDFGEIPEGGYWSVSFYQVRQGGKTVAQPKYYSFVKRTKEEKLEARYAPDGALQHVKGLQKINESQGSH